MFHFVLLIVLCVFLCATRQAANPAGFARLLEFLATATAATFAVSPSSSSSSPSTSSEASASSPPSPHSAAAAAAVAATIGLTANFEILQPSNEHVVAYRLGAAQMCFFAFTSPSPQVRPQPICVSERVKRLECLLGKQWQNDTRQKAKGI
jgi:hypothetical protein